MPGWPRLSDQKVDLLSRLELSMTVGSPWDKVLKEQGLTRTTVVQGDRTLTLTGSGVAGRSIELFIGVPVLLVGLIGAVIAVIRRRRHRDTSPPSQFTGVVYQRAIG